MSTAPSQALPPIAFIGGGNMAGAIIGGLVRQAIQPSAIQVVEPLAEQREHLQAQWGVQALAQADARLQQARIVVWAVKPQSFAQAAQQAGAHTAGALHLSVAAGIRTDSMRRWLASGRIVRAMPNTPALVGQGVTGLYACDAVSPQERASIETIIATTGQWIWLPQEQLLDAVTALSGSGPAYVFYFLQAMTEAGVQMGLSAEQARQLAVATFSGSAALAADSKETLQTLREQVTSKGGTTFAALSAMEAAEIKSAFIAAMHAARARAQELGEQFGSQ